MTDQRTPAEIYAALKLLEHALKEALAEAAEAADEFRRSSRAKQLETDWGLVSLTRRKPTVAVVDDAALLAWCEEHAPQAIIRTVSPAAVKQLLASWAIEGDEQTGYVVVDPEGEIVPFAAVKPGGESLTVRLTPEAKEHAARTMTAVRESLAVSFTRSLELAALREQAEAPAEEPDDQSWGTPSPRVPYVVAGVDRDEAILRVSRGYTSDTYDLDPDLVSDLTDAQKLDLASGGDLPFGGRVVGNVVTVHTD